ncbi:helix-turn-helix domain-containing protein [Tranquillimonas rosea]|uniref:helix-turn-helix domain-containing protein n=1 Tax=Tranquillimonas rosea TaxID=641238 RepID=UPI003BAC7D9F
MAERLTQAREYAGLPKNGLARLADLSSASVGAYERGVQAPTDEVIVRLAKTLNVDPELLTTPMDGGPVDRVFWRRMARDTVQSQRRTTAYIQWACEAIYRVEDFVELPPLNLPDFKFTDWTRISDFQIEEAAMLAREHWGLGTGPIADVTRVIENAGIPVLEFEVENRGQAGFTHPSDLLGRPVIGFNSFEQTNARQRFSLAHELGHLLLHETVRDVDLSTSQRYRQIENQAHRFAAAFLFPHDAYVRSVRYHSLEEMASLKRTWGVAVLTQIKRSEQLGCVSSEKAQALFVQAGRRRFRRPFGEPWDRDTPLEAPRLLARSIDLLSNDAPLSYNELIETMPFPRSVLQEAFGRSFAPISDNVVQLKPRVV